MTNAKLRNKFWVRSWVIGILLSACTSLGPPPTVTPLPFRPPPTPSTPAPEGTATTFLEDWQKSDYAGMYSFLSPLSRDAISLADFQARYESVAKAATLVKVEAHVLSARKNGATAQVAYSVTFHTAVVGDILKQTEMQLIYTNDRWAISWTEGMILPELTGGNTLVLDYTRPARANIYDRNGLGLAAQGQGKAVVVGVQSGKITDEAAVLTALSRLLGLSPETIKQKYASVPPDWYVPIGQVSAEAVQADYATLSTLSGVSFTASNTRDYLFGGVAPQVVGYLSAIPPEALADYQTKGYSGDERVGRAGLEAWGEQYLAGKRGGKLNVITPSGQPVTTLAESQPQPSQAIYTTLDRSLQMAAQQALGNFKGSIIVLNPQTGEVLAMVSNPTFDPNLFEPTHRDNALLSATLNDPGKPLLNRATQGLYPPGSVFKVAMMAAGLLSGLYTRDTPYTCTGKWDLLGPGAIKYDWTVSFGVKPHGTINLVQALAFSCDNYFYTVAYNLYQYNPDYMSQVAREFGLGDYTQIGQAAEAQGLIPDPEWKLKTYGEKWTPGDSVNMGIGQGYVLVTPLQIAQMMAAVRNGGTLYRPQLVHHIAPPGGAPTYQFEPIVNGKLPTTPEQLALIQEGLRDVTSIPGGTARYRFLNLEIPVAGKTGTAEDPGSGGPPHAWFAGYTEANRPDKPDIVIVVNVENKGEGSEFAAPIFRRIVETYFLGRPLTLYDWESEFGTPATPTPAP
jgi:penicillin-binding protein 2